ncbi:hypothetical protein Ancab_016271 [Ancistrocladus abbreviatus]
MVSQENPSNPTSTSILHQFLISDLLQNQFEHQHFNAYGSETDVRNTRYPGSLGVYPTIQSLGERMSRSVNLVQDHGGGVPADESEMGHTRHVMDLLGAPNEANRLSLSLGSRGHVSSLQYTQGTLNPADLITPSYLFSCQEACNLGSGGMHHVTGGHCSFPGCCSAVWGNRSCSSNPYNNMPLPNNIVGNSRYLKAVQSLMEEVVNVGGRSIELGEVKRLFLGGRGGNGDLSFDQLRAELLSTSNAAVLSTEKHHLQIRISKLLTLLEQVESRYDEYCNRMEQVVSSFEVIAGEGAAKTYTALALQAMSRHFCSLRDAILSQIKVVRKKISPRSNTTTSGGAGLSQLSLFDSDQPSRHNTTTTDSRMSLQQLGMIQGQRQTWRPIRGLPESSVAILRAWLFEHFLHPYPNDSEKLILASQTGLTKNQVSNWFINARVRLWKPMIEEMYKEEFGESSVDSDSLFSSTFAAREGAVDHADE